MILHYSLTLAKLSVKYVTMFGNTVRGCCSHVSLVVTNYYFIVKHLSTGVGSGEHAFFPAFECLIKQLNIKFGYCRISKLSRPRFHAQ